MQKNNNEKTYWPHMILGFLSIGITLGYWTVKSASSLPVQESNLYMMSYQKADININQILKNKKRFDSLYTIEIKETKMMTMTDNIYSHRVQAEAIRLHKGLNHFAYQIKDKQGNLIDDANTSFLLTQPHSRKHDKFISSLNYEKNSYVVKDINISKAGRYTLQFRAVIKKDIVGYANFSAYLEK